MTDEERYFLGEGPSEQGRKLFRDAYELGYTRGRAKSQLTPANVRHILKELKDPYWGQQVDLAEEFGVTSQTICDIKHGRVWACVTGLNKSRNKRGK